MSDHLVSLKGDIPIEFARRSPRGLEDLCRFKATELHFILHHAGPIIFKEALFMEDKTKRFYNHYLIVHTVVRILGDEQLFRGEGVIDKCEDLLKEFVTDAAKEEYYGEHFISYNIHNTIHVPKDVKYFDRPLYEFSCYQNENHLQCIKALVVTFVKELEQVIKRVDEVRRNVISKSPSQNCYTNLFSSYTLSESDICIPDVHYPITGTFYRKVVCGPIELRICHPENTVQIKQTNQIFRISNIVKTPGDELLIIGHHFTVYDDFFNYPFPSSTIGTWKVSALHHNWAYHRIQDVKCKCVPLSETNPFSGSYVVSPIPLFSTSMNHD